MLRHFRLIRTAEKCPFENLHPDNGEHELQHVGDQENIADCFDGHNDALHHVLNKNKNPAQFTKKIQKTGVSKGKRGDL